MNSTVVKKANTEQFLDLIRYEKQDEFIKIAGSSYGEDIMKCFKSLVAQNKVKENQRKDLETASAKFLKFKNDSKNEITEFKNENKEFKDIEKKLLSQIKSLENDQQQEKSSGKFKFDMAVKEKLKFQKNFIFV